VALIRQIADDEHHVDSAGRGFHLLDYFFKKMAALGIDVMQIVHFDEGEVLGSSVLGEKSAGPDSSAEQGGGGGLHQSAAGKVHGPIHVTGNRQLKKPSHWIGRAVALSS
jgi:hypothetical protein